MHIHLDSSTASIQVAGTYQWLYPNAIRLGTPADSIRVALGFYSFFQIVPNIPSSASTLHYTTGGDSGTAAVEPGQYDAATLVARINSLVPVINLSLDDISSRISINASGQVVELSGSLLTPLGFDTSSVVVAAQGVMAPNVVRLGGPRYLSIETNFTLDTVTNDDQQSSVLARVPIRVDYGQHEIYDNSNLMFSDLGDHQLTSIAITIRDDTGKVVDWRGSQWSLSLYFEVVPRPYQPLEEQYNSVGNQNKEEAPQ